MKEKIAKWYRQGLWTKKMVCNEVLKKFLTEQEANEILNGGVLSNGLFKTSKSS